MQVTRVSKEDLLTVLNENRSKHRQVFEAAVAGFRIEAVARLNRYIEQVKAGKLHKNLYVEVAVPVDHTRDYDRIIRMVEMHTGSTFELSERDFGMYVMDDWNWKREFVQTSNSYAAATVSEVYGADAIFEED